MTGIVQAILGMSFGAAAAAQVLRSKKGITAIGNAQVDTAQSKFGGTSAVFDGSGDYLQIVPNGSFAYTGDFTIEGWIRPGSFANAMVLFSQGSAESSMISIYVAQTTGTLYYYAYSANRITGSNLSLNTWYHIAVSRSGNSIKLFVDGTQVGSTYTDSTSIQDATFNIGAWINATSSWSGWIDEFRISKTARYTSNFSAPTVPFVNDDNTLLLVHCNGTDATTYFEDDNGVTTIRTAKTLTAVNNAQLDTAQYKFGQSSMLFDGTGDCITTSTSSDFLLSTNFTIEFQIRFAAVDALYVPLCQRPGVGVANGDWWCEVTAAEDEMYWGFKNTAGTQYYVNLSLSGSAFATNTWYHIALVCSNNVMQLYQNGTAVGTTTSVTGTFGSSSTPVTIGALGNASTYSYSLNGWIDELRISKVARYTANFTAPTTTFENDANTLLLIHAEGADASTTVTDDNSGRSSKSIVGLGSAQISTAQSKFGGSSFVSTYTGQNYLSVANSSDLLTSTDALTIEGWFRPDLAGDSGQGVGTRFWYFKGVNTSGGVGLGVTTDGIRFRGPSTNDLVYTGTVSSSSWSHIAFVWNGSTKKIYLNGTEVASTSDSLNITDTSDITIGPYFSDNRFNYSGYIDEIRVSNVARYTAAFTAPTTPFVNDTNTLLLIHADGTNASTVFRDDNGISQRVGSHISYFGSAVISTAQSKFGGASYYGDGASNYLLANIYNKTSITNFTFECWLRISSTANGAVVLFQGYPLSTDKQFYVVLTGAEANRIYLSSSGGYQYSSWTPSLNTWYHIALTVASNGDAKIWVDGVQQGTTKSATIGSVIGSSNTDPLIAFGRYQQSNLSALYGYMDEIRLSNTVRYTATFTPSTTAFTNDANTLLLVHADGANSSTTFVDDNGGRQQRGVIAVANAQVDTAQSKFGGASVLFDGNTDKLTIDSQVLPLTGDWTIECWFRASTLGTQNNLWYAGPNGHTPYFYSSGVTWYDWDSNLNVSTTISTNTWYHFVCEKQGSTRRMYLNGSVIGTASTGDRTTSYLWIGAHDFDTAKHWNGHIDEFRVSNTARYQGTAFTPSTTPFQNDDNTLLLLHMDGTDASTVFFDDNGVKPYTP